MPLTGMCWPAITVYWRPTVSARGSRSRVRLGNGRWAVGIIEGVEQQENTYQADVTLGGQQQELSFDSATVLDDLIAMLARDDAREATIRAGEDDPALEVQLHGEHGYLLYAGDEHLVYSVGDPESAALEQASEAGFPAGSGVTLEQFREVVAEFVNNHGRLPNSITWQDAQPD